MLHMALWASNCIWGFNLENYCCEEMQMDFLGVPKGSLFMVLSEMSSTYLGQACFLHVLYLPRVNLW